jgi:hypothetical protein
MHENCHKKGGSRNASPLSLDLVIEHTREYSCRRPEFS